MRLKEQAECCELRDNRQDRILEQLIQTTEGSEMIRKVIQKRMEFKQVFRRSKSTTPPRARSKRNKENPNKNYERTQTTDMSALR